MSGDHVAVSMAANKRARELAAEVKEFILDVVRDIPEDEEFNETSFWEIMADFVTEHGNGKEIFNPIHPNVMMPSEVQAFTRVIVPWGKHRGEEVGRVPPDYWAALAASTFYRRLLRYVRTDYFKALLAREGD